MYARAKPLTNAFPISRSRTRPPTARHEQVVKAPIRCEARGPIPLTVPLLSSCGSDRLILEDLHIAGMLRNHHLAQAIADAGWAEVARIIGYRQAWAGGQVLLADRWFSSTKTSAACGTVRGTLGLGECTFTCPQCGWRCDRDTNAAVDLAVGARRGMPRLGTSR